jgi:sugar/nucleoside kinase (ribokinase family)
MFQVDRPDSRRKPMGAAYDVVALGNAILDVIAPVDESFLVKHEIPKARMNMIDEARCAYLYGVLPDNRTETSGGSAGNTIAGLCSLGARAAFLGKVADDQTGAIYISDMRRVGADFFGDPLIGGPATARSMIAVTPDGERSMNTFLGASTEFAAADVRTDVIAGGEWLYLEGYLFDKPSAQRAFVHACEIAKASGRKVALTLSDVFCVTRHRSSFIHLVKSHVDLVFANESELLALYETESFDEAVSAVRRDSRLAAVTRSELGSVVIAESETWTAPANRVDKVVDATGAGDQYAAGFLFGLTHGLSLPDSARLGNLAAHEVITHIGPRPATSLHALGKASGLLT